MSGEGSVEGTHVEVFDAIDVIRAKRDGHAVPEDALRWMVDAYTREYVSDAQMAAFAMAVLLNGMDRDEIRVLTDAMIASGERMSFAELPKTTVDKHSTGGVGDKITLPLAPLVASFGVAVPQLSGRGLGHTGGTLDKLESIPGWRAALSNDELFAQLADVGAVICAAGSGWYQEEGHDAVSLEPGAVVFTRAGVKHWHGAKSDSWFSHIALGVPGENSSTEWLQPVDDAHYDALGEGCR